jgi:dimethyl-sulfide monooxygenase
VGFGVTAAITFEHPYLLARRLSTLDHLTKGRVAWNVVSSYLNSAALNIGLDKQIAHDERYDIGDEYMEVMYKLWEGSWEDGAVLRDRQSGVFTDPAKVHPINHDGKYYKVPGFHLCEPSPQRTPFIFQAGASSRGRTFAAEHGEAVFILAPNVEHALSVTTDIRDLAEKAGRSRDSVKIITMLTIVTGVDDEAAQRKYDEYLSYANPEGMLALWAGWTGLDFSTLDPNEPLRAIQNDSMRTMLEALTESGERNVTVLDVIKERCIGGAGPTLVGGPETIADTLERWVDEGGLDGFNLAYAVSPGTLSDFIDYVLPELQRRGRAQTAYTSGTLRQKMMGGPDGMVEETHPAARQRGAYAGKESVADKTLPSAFDTLSTVYDIRMTAQS